MLCRLSRAGGQLDCKSGRATLSSESQILLSSSGELLDVAM